MAKNNLETKARKAVLNIEGKVSDMYNVLKDLSMKLCHLIKSRDIYGNSPNEIYY